MNKKSAPTVELRLETTIEEERKIIRLINSSQYFLGFVFIVFEEESCRLVVYRKGEIVTDQGYKTAQGAKIAFLKFFRFMAYNEKIRAKWSHAYPPDKEWLEKNLKEAPTG